MPDSSETQQLRDEIKRLLADALRGEASHAAELRRRDGVHEAEADERELTFIEQLDRQARLHADEIALLLSAIRSRDIIGQAKGVIMATMGCSADEAFELLKQQSQHQNRKLVEIAGEVASRADRRQRVSESAANS